MHFRSSPVSLDASPTARAESSSVGASSPTQQSKGNGNSLPHTASSPALLSMQQASARSALLRASAPVAHSPIRRLAKKSTRRA